MNTTTTPTNLTRPSAPIRRTAWRAGATATIVGAVAAAAYGWLLDTTGVPMLAGGPGATRAQEVPIVTFAWGTAMLTIVATLIAVTVSRRARRPRHTFVMTTGVLALISVGLPLAAGATATSTKLTFALGHIVLAAIIIPIIARDLEPVRAE